MKNHQSGFTGRLARSGLTSLLALSLSGCPSTSDDYTPSPSSSNPTYTPPKTPSSPVTTPTIPSVINNFVAPTTGVKGYNTVEEIMNTPKVIQALSNLEQASKKISPNSLLVYLEDPIKFSDPPNLEGTYSISGWRVTPSQVALLPGTFRFYNQTPDLHISADYTQFLGGGETQSGISTEGRIIVLGVDKEDYNGFTTYSVVNATQGGCSAKAILIMSGGVQKDGTVVGSYVAPIVSQTGNCGQSTDVTGIFSFYPK